jgi:hypothetical protein
VGQRPAPVANGRKREVPYGAAGANDRGLGCSSSRDIGACVNRIAVQPFGVMRLCGAPRDLRAPPLGQRSASLARAGFRVSTGGAAPGLVSVRLPYRVLAQKFKEHAL